MSVCSGATQLPLSLSRKQRGSSSQTREISGANAKDVENEQRRTVHDEHAVEHGSLHVRPERRLGEGGQEVLNGERAYQGRRAVQVD